MRSLTRKGVIVREFLCQSGIENIPFHTANQLNGAPKVILYGEKIRFACAKTSSGVTEWTSTFPPDSWKLRS